MHDEPSIVDMTYLLCVPCVCVCVCVFSPSAVEHWQSCLPYLVATHMRGLCLQRSVRSAGTSLDRITLWPGVCACACACVYVSLCVQRNVRSTGTSQDRITLWPGVCLCVCVCVCVFVPPEERAQHRDIPDYFMARCVALICGYISVHSCLCLLMCVYMF